MKPSAHDRFAQKRVRKEAIDVPEEPRKDRSLDQLIQVHEHRLQRLERERKNARNAWRETRRTLTQLKEQWRNALQESQTYWQNARTRFFAMQITSGEFRRSKAVYERLKQDAAELKAGAVDHVSVCRDTKKGFFSACQMLKAAYLHIEKLKTLRDEMRRQSQEVNT